MIKKILLGLVAVIAIFLIVAALQPSDFRVTRSMKINAAPAAVFSQVNDLHQWEAWSPWAKRDPNMKQTYEGSASGVGAGYTWAGNHEVGEGRMTIMDSRPNEMVAIKLDFLKPFAGTNHAEFTFTPEGDGTLVSWSMEGKKHFVCKAMSLCMDMDKMIGNDFEQGLTAMKAICETPSPKLTSISPAQAAQR